MAITLDGTSGISTPGLVSIQNGTVTYPASGYGWELYNVDTATNYMQAYNRSASAWMDGVYASREHIIHTVGAERMRVNALGQVKMPYQPAMRAGPNDGWQNFLNQTRGWLGTFKNLRGGFFEGGNPGSGYNVIHVPVAGYYWINMKVYKSAACDSRLYLRISTGAEPLFIHTGVTSADMTMSASVIYYLTAGEWLAFRWAIGTNATAYYGEAHTEICATFLG